jgi:hypothetical protein
MGWLEGMQALLSQPVKRMIEGFFTIQKSWMGLAWQSYSSAIQMPSARVSAMQQIDLNKFQR